MGWPVLAAALAIFALSYTLFFVRYVHRTLAALAGAVAMAVVGSTLGFFPHAAVVASIDADTLWLLFGMMVMVGLLRETGFFQYTAIRAAKLARGNPTVLLLSLALCTAVASMFLDNVTTLITVVPVTLSVAEVLGIPAGPFLLAEAMAANIGGTATLIGDPPNILIGSAAGLSFNAFLTHTLPVSVIVLIGVLGFLVVRFRRTMVPARHVEEVMAMDERRALADPSAMGKLVTLLGLVFALFLFHSALGLTPGVVALLGAALSALVLRPSIESFLRGVEWELLLFLAALLVITGGLQASGALGAVGQWAIAVSGGSTLILALLLLWAGALLSCGLSAIPTTAALVAVVRSLAGTGIPLTPLWWALALGIGLGANGTPMGSAANLVMTSLAARSDRPLSNRAWLRDGVPVAVFSCCVASLFVWLGIATGWFL